VEWGKMEKERKNNGKQGREREREKKGKLLISFFEKWFLKF